MTGDEKRTPKGFSGLIKVPFFFRALDYLTSYVALSQGMGVEGNPIMAYLMGFNPALMLTGFLLLSANVYFLAKMYSRYTRTVLLCYFAIIVFHAFLATRNMVYIILWSML